MNEPGDDGLLARVQRLEDESAIQRLIMSYGPAADAGLTGVGGEVCGSRTGSTTGMPNGAPHVGSAAVDEMLQGDGHQGLIARGVAHFAGPLLVAVAGDGATVLNYSLIMRREDDRFFLWRVSAVRWDVERAGSSWKVRRRTNRLLDATGAGRELFNETMRECFRRSDMSGGRLEGKVAIITGASTGLGPVMGALFVREGARVLLAARREELVREAAEAAGGGTIAMRADVTDEDDVAAMVTRAVEEFGRVDVLCNNAAAPGKDLWIWEQTLENWNATIAIDVTAAMLCTREVLQPVDAGAIDRA